MPGTIQYTVVVNKFGDTLPIIPTASSVQQSAVQFQLDLQIVVLQNGKPGAGLTIPFTVTPLPSTAVQQAATNAQGIAKVRLTTRHTGAVTVTPGSPDFATSRYSVTIGQAWYEATFQITAYNVCAEDDFSGKMVDGTGVGSHKEDFLFGGSGVIMQGTGKATNGRYVRITNPTAIAWNPHYAGVRNPKDAVFEYTDGVHGAYATCEENMSIAVDPSVLPPHHRVQIVGPRDLGVRRADDTGGKIRDHHFDVFAGGGKAVMDAWTSAGGNIAAAKVKYLGR